MLYSETETFLRACLRAHAKIPRMPDVLTKTGYARADIVANARAYLAAANAISAAAAAVLSQIDPPAAEVHHHHVPLPTPPFSDGARSSAGTGGGKTLERV